MWLWEQLRHWVRLLHADRCTLHIWQAVADQQLSLCGHQAWVIMTMSVQHALDLQDSNMVAFCVPF